MFACTITFFIISLTAAVVDFSGLGGPLAAIAGFFFYVSGILCLLSFVMHPAVTNFISRSHKSFSHRKPAESALR